MPEEANFTCCAHGITSVISWASSTVGELSTYRVDPLAACSAIAAVTSGWA